MFLLHHKRRQLAHLLEKAALQHTFDQQLLQSRLETQEQSFQYFSEEIHDNVGQVLSVVGMHLYQLESLCEGGRARKLATQSSELLNKAIADLRTISHTLNAQYVSRAGLVESLQQELDYINSVKGAQCRLELSGDPVALSADRETLLYRILQEAMGNALKHARATEIVISIRYGQDSLTAAVADNGQGFDAAAAGSSRAGLGLTNMQLRAGLLGGTLQVQSHPGAGTALSLTVLVHPKEHSANASPN